MLSCLALGSYLNLAGTARLCVISGLVTVVIVVNASQFLKVDG
jgi:hypothetical protein